MSIARETKRSAGEPERLGGDYRRVADADELGCLLAAVGADVDMQALQLDHLLARFGVEQVQWLAPDDTRHRAVATLDLKPLAHQDLGVPTSDRREPEEALLVDVADHQPDLVDVADDREQRRWLADAGYRGADPIG